VIGDLDSLTEEEISRLQSGGAQVIQFPTRKDSTDLELALQHAELLTPDEILIYGALGKRWDQTIANLLLAGAYPLARIRLVDGDQEIRYVRARETLRIEGEPGDTVSLIPLSGDVEGITTRGLDYPLKDERLSFGSTRGVSNVLLGDRAEVTLREGLLVCVVIHQPGSPLQEEEHED
jgi:thiamine pyrophosphokinase